MPGVNTLIKTVKIPFRISRKARRKLYARFPKIGRFVQRGKQRVRILTSKKRITEEGNLVRVSPNDGNEYSCGFYDKSPWDSTERFILCFRAKTTYMSVAPSEPCTLGVIDTQNQNQFIELGHTNAWNVQQGCMAQWLGPDYSSRIIYNDFRDNRYCAVIYNFADRREEKILPMPVCDVARDGSFLLSLDFSRLHRMRPGYGYSNLEDTTKGELCPDQCCIWKVDIETGAIDELFKYTDFAAFEPDESMSGAEHKVNHIMISPNSKRFMVLHRWFENGRKHTRLVTANIDKTGMYNLSDDIFVSHCFWKNDNEILSFLRKKETGNHYYLLKDKSQECQLLWPELNTDGHCSYSPDGSHIITDTYPDYNRIASVYLCEEENNRIRCILRVFSPFKYYGNCRCDLHPRWNRNGDKICIDSVHEGKRGVYISAIPFEERVTEYEERPENAQILVSCVIPTYKRNYMILRAVQSVLNQTHKNIEVIVVDDNDPDDAFSKDVKNKLSCVEDNRFKYIGQKKHTNGAAARNAGIKAAKGMYVAFLDDDDEWETTKIAKQLEYLSANKDCNGCSCLWTSYSKGAKITEYPPYSNDNLLFKILSRKVRMFTSTVLLNREALIASGMFDEELIRHQDLQMLADYAANNKIAVLNEHLVRLHKDSGINRPKTNEFIVIKQLYLKKMERHIQSFSKRDQKRIYAAHDLEVIEKSMREHNTKAALKYIFKNLTNHTAYAEFFSRSGKEKNNT